MKIILVVAFMFLAAAYPGCAKDKAKGDDSQAIADRIVESKIPVLVDFWAGWCMPCHILDPIIQELEKEYKGRVLFVKVDVDVHRSIVRFFEVSALPTIVVIEDKTVRSVLPGVREKQAYRDAIDKALALAKERKEE